MINYVLLITMIFIGFSYSFISITKQYYVYELKTLVTIKGLFGWVQVGWIAKPTCRKKFASVWLI